MSRKLIVNIVGAVLGVGVLIGAYTIFMKPKVDTWRAARGEIQQREDKLKALRTSFDNQYDPKSEIRTLRKEIKNLEDANKSFDKIRRPGMETSDLPPEINDPDPEIRIELIRHYMVEVMNITEEKLKTTLRNAQVSPPEIELYNDLENAEEAAYYVNRAGGLTGIVDAMAQTKSEGANLYFQDVQLENYEEGNKRRSGAINVLSYQLKMTMDTQSLLTFLYTLQEQEGFYYVSSMQIEPSAGRRGASQLSIEARIETTMVFESQVENQLKAVAAKTGATGKKKGGRGGDWMSAVIAGMKAEAEAEKARQANKKWWQFWI